ISGGGDLSSNRTLALTGQALAFHNFAGNGLFARTGPGGFDSRRIVGGDGITVENGDGVSGNPTVSLTTTNRTIIGGGGITVTNGDGAAGNPTVTLSGTFPGTFQADFFSIVNPTGSYWVGADTTGFQNNTSASMRAGRFAVNTGSNDASVFVHNSLNTSASVAAFLFGKQELTVGSIVFTSTGVIYNQTSDRRQKDEISDLSVEDAMAAVRSYQCRTFRWISTGQRDTGFIAQEFATVCPGAVSGDPDGDEMMTMQASNAKTIAEMMRCIQYLLVEIEALKSA
ncbi:MAG: tail fiber domain-containing protein, partial [Pseudomonadota bacterium]